jgi:hypothetical protein
LVLKSEISLCGFRAFSTQIDGLSVVFGTGMSVEKIATQHISPYKELATAIGHAFIVNQVIEKNKICWFIKKN